MNNENETPMPVGSDDLVLPLRVLDLDSPFLFGVVREMTEKETLEARRHGRFDNPPMSVLGITSDGLAAVEGEDMARLFAAAPDLLAACQHVIATHGHHAQDCCKCEDCEYLRPISDAIRKALGQNSRKDPPA